MTIKDVYAPSAYLARGIERVLFAAKEAEDPLVHGVSCLSAKILGALVFPVVLLGELVVEPFFLCYALNSTSKQWNDSLDRIVKLSLGILCSPLAWIAADGVSYLFLQREPMADTARIAPFGVEHIYGSDATIYYPDSIEEVQSLVKKAKKEGKKIAIRGSGFSQGIQTVPVSSDSLVLDLRKIKKMEFIEGEESVRVGAGAIWEDVQQFVNEKGKSVIVKQASDVFSIGGSIAINCHGWEHAAGSIASTVESLDVVDASGNVRTLSLASPSLEDRELFSAMFGTLGYFGVIVSATLKVKDNVMYQEKGVSIPLKEFHSYYKEQIVKNNQEGKIPLLIGRLRLNGTPYPLQEVYLQTFEEKAGGKVAQVPLVTPNFEKEPHRGQRIERIFLDALGHLPTCLFHLLQNWFWNREVKAMEQGREATRNEIMHFGLKSFYQLHQSDLYTQWLQEYFVSEEHLEPFLHDLGKVLHEHDVRLLNASIRPTPQDSISLLPYAEKNRYAIVLSFHQLKTKKELEKTRTWIRQVQQKLLSLGDKWYQAYMPIASQEEFESCYGKDRVEQMRALKKKFDPENLFSNQHTKTYFDLGCHS